MFDFADKTAEMTAGEILNYYRNLYYTEPQVTERGIVANAINDYFQESAPRSEVERWRDMYYRANAERMASKNDYEFLMASVKTERRVAEMNILKAIRQEIINARIVSQKALAERRNEPGVDPNRDARCFYCNGRIDALSCLLAFVEECERICMEDKNDKP